MKNEVLLVCKDILDKFTEQEILKYKWVERRIMSDLLRNLISDVSVFIQMKTTNLKEYSDEQIKQMDEKTKNIIKLYIRMRRNPRLTINLISEYKKRKWLEYQEIMKIYRKFSK